MRSGDADVATFVVEENEQPRTTCMLAAFFEGDDPATAEAFEAGTLRLDDWNDARDGVDHAEAEGADGGDGVVVLGAKVWGQLFEDWIKAYAGYGRKRVAASDEQVGEVRRWSGGHCGGFGIGGGNGGGNGDRNVGYVG